MSSVQLVDKPIKNIQVWGGNLFTYKMQFDYADDSTQLVYHKNKTEGDHQTR